jgi:hypothetical protein
VLGAQEKKTVHDAETGRLLDQTIGLFVEHCSFFSNSRLLYHPLQFDSGFFHACNKSKIASLIWIVEEFS